jgi:hypothetical protein
VPVTGRKPKPDGQKRNRVKPTHDWTEVANAPFEGGPKLPKRMPNGLPWPSATQRWWAVISAMPHCTLWSESDWQYAFDTAYVAGIFHMQGSNTYATELRNREKVLGTTADYRRDLRIRYVDQAEEPDDQDAGVTKLADYREAF